MVTYTLGCFSKHVNNFWVLAGGRLLCGVSTSLLFSAFESWLVAEHFKRGFHADWLGNTFSQAVFLGNGLIAIVAGACAGSERLLGHAEQGGVCVPRPFTTNATSTCPPLTLFLQACWRTRWF